MQIQFQVEGGIAHFPGLSRPVTVDTSSLPPAQAAGLENLVRTSGFFQRPPQVGTPARGAADYRTYTIHVENGAQSHTVRIVEPVEDSSLQALIDALRAHQKQIVP
jgi:hypothetical protein